MILTKTPLRISFVGGGSDRPGFYQEEPGACVAAAIDKFVWVAVKKEFTGRVLAHYRATEDVATVAELRHDRMRACLQRVEIETAIEVTSMADIPGSSGLGSSSSFTVGLLAALRPGKVAATYAETACDVELGDLGAPIGKQDQYTAAYGGLNLLSFTSAGVDVKPLVCDLDALSSHCLLLDTGQARQGDAGAVLASQQQDRDDVRRLAELAKEFAYWLPYDRLDICAAVMHKAWKIKRRFIANGQVNDWYRTARDEGAWGGKLCGAGGGGFLLFLAPPERHQAITQALGLRHVPIRLGVEGCRVVYAA